MTPVHPFFAVGVFFIAFITAYILQSVYKITLPEGRYETVDGLRGFLALSVFIHHASLWHQYLHTDGWFSPPSHLYTHLGKTSVALFFMITSFLFISKLLNAPKKEFDWNSFFISRIFRLVPMYYVSLAMMIVLILSITNWKLNVEGSVFLDSIFNWSLFTIHDAPIINNTPYHVLVNSGVVWSLPYEWLFYFSLPIISLFILKTKPSYLYIAISIAFIYNFYFDVFQEQPWYRYFIYCFIGGAFAPVLLKFTSLSEKIKTSYSIYANGIILFCLYLIGTFENTENVPCIIVITVMFTLIALGASLFGLLKNPVLKLLGEMSYSTYLLHGMVLFTTFYFIYGFYHVRNFTPLQFCLIVFALTSILVFLSFLGFNFIEKPFMEKSKIITQKMENKKQNTL
jgi:peptidoglycan/LPS O-acetylase OafA/YrhL